MKRRKRRRAVKERVIRFIRILADAPLSDFSRMSEASNFDKKHSFNFGLAKDLAPWLAIFALLVLTAFQLSRQGRIWRCKLGDYAFWSGDAWGSHNSQHIFDPYAFTHILHGILYFWLICLFFRRMPLFWQLFLAILAACVWEISENTNTVIERYRTATLSLDYYGDSIFNSLGDIFSAAVGFIIAYKLRFWRSLVLFLLTEIILLLWIRDSLLLNILMLIYPIESVKEWQSAITR